MSRIRTSIAKRPSPRMSNVLAIDPESAGHARLPRRVSGAAPSSDLVKLGRPADAAPISSAVAVDHDAFLLNALGWAYDQDRQPNRCRACYREAVATPKGTAAYLNLGRLKCTATAPPKPSPLWNSPWNSPLASIERLQSVAGLPAIGPGRRRRSDSRTPPRPPAGGRSLALKPDAVAAQLNFDDPRSDPGRHEDVDITPFPSSRRRRVARRLRRRRRRPPSPKSAPRPRVVRSGASRPRAVPPGRTTSSTRSFLDGEIRLPTAPIRNPNSRHPPALGSSRDPRTAARGVHQGQGPLPTRTLRPRNLPGTRPFGLTRWFPRQAGASSICSTIPAASRKLMNLAFGFT